MNLKATTVIPKTAQVTTCVKMAWVIIFPVEMSACLTQPRENAANYRLENVGPGKWCIFTRNWSNWTGNCFLNAWGTMSPRYTTIKVPEEQKMSVYSFRWFATLQTGLSTAKQKESLCLNTLTNDSALIWYMHLPVWILRLCCWRSLTLGQT